ncbi:MAG: amino acid adenylation domain-containing protein [Thermoanaerobaculales bacterium]|nr:amino acid adenylation domain-containing protein [Thermoanaerobaculales bacterium]
MALSLVDLLGDASRDHASDRAVALPGAGELSYRQLDLASLAVARTLAAAGVGKGDRVGLVLPKNLHAVVGLWGAMRAGAAYVPIDPASPADRAALIAADCRMAAILASAELAETVDAVRRRVPGLRVVPLDGPAGLFADGLDRPPGDAGEAPGRRLPAVNVRDLAYILYTSGSTGVPKGVMVSHGAALSFVEWAARRFGLAPDDVLSSHAPLHFDLSTFDFFASCLAGASVVVFDEETVRFPMAAADLLESAGITVWYSVPRALRTMLRMGRLAERDLGRLRTVLFAGEPYPADELRELQRALPGVSLFNLYGPTETNVCTYWEVPPPGVWTSSSVPVGVDCENCEGVVVDEDLRPVPDGTAGELLVRGGTLMEGYWGDPEKTARSFVGDFRYPHLSDRFYRTGDIVARRADGNYDFFGRADHMVKIRGYRVELGEIEAALHRFDGVVEAAVVAVDSRRRAGEDRELVAFVVANGGSGDREEVTASLKAHLEAIVPKYMIPASFVWLDRLPATSTGKVDRQRLAGLAEAASG